MTETIVVKEPEEYGPLHPEPKKGFISYLTVGDVYGAVIAVLFLTILLIVCWGFSKHMRGIASDVKVIKSQIENPPQPSSPTFNEIWRQEITELIKQAQAFDQTLQVTARTLNTMSLKVGALDYSVNGLANAMGGVENEMMLARAQSKPPPVQTTKVSKPKVKVSSPLAGPRLNGTNN